MVMAVEEVMLFCRGNRNYWTLLHLKYDRHVFATHVAMAQRIKALVKMVKTKLLKYLVVQWFIMLKQVNISVISPNTDKK